MVVNSQDRCGLHNHTAAENWTIGGLAGQDKFKFWWEAERALDKPEMERFQFNSGPRILVDLETL